ncbi:MAG TPA: hypothetical protein DDX92_02385 [Flavobacteriales bacterium]|nr:hypothetical protein [Flavobacteriales bacterium]
MTTEQNILQLLDAERSALKRGEHQVMGQVLEILNLPYGEDVVVKESDFATSHRNRLEHIQQCLNERFLYDSTIIQAVNDRPFVQLINLNRGDRIIPEESITRIHAIQRDHKIEVLDTFLLTLDPKEDNHKPSHVILAHLESDQYYVVYYWEDEEKWYQNVNTFSKTLIYKSALLSIIIGLVASIFVPVDLFPADFNGKWTALGLARLYVGISLGGLIFVVTLFANAIFSKDKNSNDQ